MENSYDQAQRGIVGIKSAVLQTIASPSNTDGLKTSEISRALGISYGYVGEDGKFGHRDYLARTILAIMEAEGSIFRTDSGGWIVKRIPR